MLVPDAKLTFPNLPDILVFPDDESPSSFYAVASKPRLALDESGTCQISLMLYGKRTAGQFQPTGGFLSLTVSLGLRPEEEKALLAQLAPKATSPMLLGLPWLTGNVTLTLGPDIRVTSTPSMMGDNRCSFSIKLTADQATGAAGAWRDHLRSLDIHYQTEVRGGPKSQSRTTYSESQTASRAGSQYQAQSHFHGETISSYSSPLSMQFAGCLGLSDAELNSHLSQVEL